MFRVALDPAVIRYEQLLEQFGARHNPCRSSWSLQYRAAVFTADDAQRQATEASARALGQRIDSEEAFVDSTLAARVNAFCDGELDREALAGEPARMGFRPAGGEVVGAVGASPRRLPSSAATLRRRRTIRRAGAAGHDGV